MKHPISNDALEGDIAILGRKGKGKTIVAKLAAERLLYLKHRLIVLDPVGVWWGLKSSADGKSEGFPVAVFGGTHGDVPLGAKAPGDKLAAVLCAEHVPAVLDVSTMRKGEMQTFVRDFLAELYRL